MRLKQTAVLDPTDAEPMRSNTGSSAHESYQPVSLPPKDHLIMTARIAIDDGGKRLGEFVAYDDLTTARATDYVELYNDGGDLLAVSWFDEFGIERLALDHALVQSSDRLEGAFVLIVSGDSV
jgi:hypothetical protein